MSSNLEMPPLGQETLAGSSPVRQISVFLHNRVGALLSLVRLLHEHEIEMLGFAAQDSVDLTLVRLVATDPDRAEEVLAAQGIACASKTIVVVELSGVQDLGNVLAALLGAEINIHHTYPLLVRPTQRPLLALCLDDAEVGAESLNKSGFKVLSQGDLSR